MGLLRWRAPVLAMISLTCASARADDLGSAIADAYRSNPRLEAQRASLRALDEQVIQALSPFRLNASIGAQLSYTAQRQRDPYYDVFLTSRSRQASGYITASQIISNGGRTAAQVSVAEASTLAGREQLRQQENMTLLEVVDSYVSVRRDAGIVEILRRSIGSYQRQVDQAIAREHGGDLTRTDIAQARAQLEIARTQLAAAEAQYQASRGRFVAVVGREPGELAPEPPLPGLPASSAEAYAVAEKESPLLWQAILNERAAGSQVAAERAERRPILSVNGSYGLASPYSYEARDFGRGYTGQVTFTLPLLTGGLVDSRVRAAMATRQQQQFLVEDARRSVDVDVLNAWNQAIAAREQLTAGEAGVVQATEAQEGVRRSFEEGLRSNFELLDAEQRLINAQLIVVNARYQRYASQATLLATLGRLEAAAIDQAVATYDPAANLARRRRQQFGPFQLALIPLDRLMEPSARTPPSPQLPSAPRPDVAAANVPPPDEGLATTVPINPSGRPALPPRDAFPPPAHVAPVPPVSAAASAPASP